MGVQLAHAGFVLEIDGGGAITVMDGGAGDSSAAADLITFSGSVAGFTVSVTTGISKPVIGSSDQAVLDLNSLQISGGSPGSLTIRLADTDFTQSGVNLVASSEPSVFSKAGERPRFRGRFLLCAICYHLVMQEELPAPRTRDAPADKEARDDRRAAALRRNLRRRKDQARERAKGLSDAPDSPSKP